MVKKILDESLPNELLIPAAWYGKEISKKPEIWQLDLLNEEIKEIDAALNRCLNENLYVENITSTSFPLPNLGDKLRMLQTDLKEGVGFKLIRGLPSERYSNNEKEIIFCGIGSYIGNMRSQNANGDLLGHVKDIGGDISDFNTRIYQTAERQTFHTDSTDVVGLFCIKEAMTGGESLLVSSITIYNEMLKSDPDLLKYLFDPIATDRRGEVPQGQKPFFEIPVYSWFEGYLTSLYHREYINSAQRFDEAGKLSDKHIQALDMHDKLANDPNLQFAMKLNPGDMQFVYNHTLLHDRTKFQDWSEKSERRHLLRLWLCLKNDRPLPKSFSQRYGRITIGDRGGIIVDKKKNSIHENRRQ